MAGNKSDTDKRRLEQVVAEARRNSAEREQGYRAKAMKMYPWICGRCTREFTLANAQELTVHHRDHNHDNNPEDGSNWELLCVYCHDNEHQRLLDSQHSMGASTKDKASGATHKAFAGLGDLLKKKD